MANTNNLHIAVSCFRHVRCVEPGDFARTLFLDEFLSFDGYYQEQQRIAAITDHTAYQAAKLATLPAITPGAVYPLGSSHGRTKPHERTGIMQIDIDGKDNPQVGDWATFRDELFATIPNTAYAGLSVSGKGCFLLIPVKYKERHELHFNYVAAFLSDNGIKVDGSKGTPWSARYYAFDPSAKWRPEAAPFEPYLEPEKPKVKEYAPQSFDGQDAPIWKLFTESDEWYYLLESAGWRKYRQVGDEVHFTRPGKTSGTSATFNVSKRVLNVFTDNGELLNPEGYSPMGILANLKFSGDFKAATKWLAENYKKVG